MTQPPGPDESTGPAQPSEPVPPAEPGESRETAPPEPSATAAEPAQPPAAGPVLDKTVAASAEPPAVATAWSLPPEPAGGALPGVRPASPGAAGTGEVPPQGQQPGYPAVPGAYDPAQAAQPQYPAGGYDNSQPYPVAGYDPSQPYVIYQATPTGGLFHGLADNDPLISPDYSGWWRRSIAIVKQGWRSLVALQAIGMVVSLLFSVPQALLLINVTRDLAEMTATVDPDTGEPVAPDLGPIFAVFGFAMIGAFLAVMVSFVITIACNHVAVSIAAGLRPRLGAALGLAARRVFPLIGWQILAGLLLVVGLCACVLPAIYLSAVFVLLPVVVTFERGGSAISRCFRLFHVDLGASIGRIATIFGIGIGIGVVAYVINMIIQLAAGDPGFDRQLADQGNGLGPWGGGASTAYIIAIVAGTVVSELLSRAGAVLTSPLTLTAYADLRGRVEPLSTAVLANEAGLVPPAPPAPLPGGGFEEPPPAQSHEDWMPPNR